AIFHSFTKACLGTNGFSAETDSALFNTLAQTTKYKVASQSLPSLPSVFTGPDEIRVEDCTTSGCEFRPIDSRGSQFAGGKCQIKCSLIGNLDLCEQYNCLKGSNGRCQKPQ
ncbi:MAG: hypothetical protein AAF320_07060, partial [Myxococcota bacterium]